LVCELPRQFKRTAQAAAERPPHGQIREILPHLLRQDP
jgi:hypothetical protein